VDHAHGLAAIIAAAARARAGDAPQPQSSSDAAAEQILRQAREVVGKLVAGARRLEIDCEHCDVDHRFKLEERYRGTFYLERQVGCLMEIQPLDLTGQTSRVRTTSGRPYGLASRPAETTLCGDGSPTVINPQSHTYEILKADYVTYEIIKGDSVSYETLKVDPGRQLKGGSQPADFSAAVLPYPLRLDASWNTLHSDYRIQQCPSTPTTVCIALSRRSVNAGYDKLHHEHHEIVLDRRTLLPKSWRLIYSDWDRLTTYNRFDLNPATRDLKVPPAGYREAPRRPITYNFNIAPDGSDGLTTAIDQGEQVREVMLLQSAYCALRLLHLF
jgi:hypothetical protein